MLETVIVTFGTISAAVTFIVTWVKSLLLQIPGYEGLEPKTQAVITQAVAFVAGVAIALSTHTNILTAFPQFADVPAWAGYVITGLACGGGSQFFYVVLAFLSGKVLLPAPSAQIVSGTATKVRSEYIPYS